MAAAGFENMAFREWDESHSASKVLEHAVQNHPDVNFIDGLLVSGVESAPKSRRSQKAMSLAKFLTTSLVFKERASQAQPNSGLALFKNFGWAPQPYVSRREPLSKEVR